MRGRDRMTGCASEEAVPLSSVERRLAGGLIADPRIASRAFTPPRSPRRAVSAGRLHRCERPAVAGEFARDRDRDDGAPLAALFERVPTCVEAAGALVSAVADGGGLALPALLERRAGPQRPALMPGCFDQEPSRVRVAGLGDAAEATPLAARVLTRRQPEERPERLRPEACPVAELDRQRQRGQARDSTKAAEPADRVGKRRLGSDLRDRPVERVPPRLRLQHRPVALVEGDRKRSRVKALPAQPAVVGERPGPRVVDDPVPEQQLREPVASTHQLTTHVLAGTHEIARRLFVRLRHPHRNKLTQTQQPRQPLGITAIGLDPIRPRARDPRRRRDRARDPGRRTGTREPIAGRTSLIGDTHRRRELLQPARRLDRQRRRPQAPKLTRPCVKNACNRLARVHIQPDPRTLSHSGASRNCGSTAAPLATATRANLRARRRAYAIRSSGWRTSAAWWISRRDRDVFLLEVDAAMRTHG